MITKRSVREDLFWSKVQVLDSMCVYTVTVCLIYNVSQVGQRNKLKRWRNPRKNTSYLHTKAWPISSANQWFTTVLILCTLVTVCILFPTFRYAIMYEEGPLKVSDHFAVCCGYQCIEEMASFVLEITKWQNNGPCIVKALNGAFFWSIESNGPDFYCYE